MLFRLSCELLICTAVDKRLEELGTRSRGYRAIKPRTRTGESGGWSRVSVINGSNYVTRDARASNARAARVLYARGRASRIWRARIVLRAIARNAEYPRILCVQRVRAYACVLRRSMVHVSTRVEQRRGVARQARWQPKPRRIIRRRMHTRDTRTRALRGKRLRVFFLLLT